MKMPWGKYKGMRIEDIPSEYLRWAAANFSDDVIAEAADEEYNWREECGEHFWEDE